MKLGSRKLWLAIGMEVFLICAHLFLGLPIAITVKWMSGIAIGYLSVEGGADIVKRIKG